MSIGMVATKVGQLGDTCLWELDYPVEKIQEAAKACTDLFGEESYSAFREALRTA